MSPVPDRPNSLVKRAPLWLLALVSATGYLLFAFWFPLRSEYHQAPLADVFSFSASLLGGLGYAALVGGLGLLCWQAYRQVLRSPRPPSLGRVLAPAALFCLPLLFTFPINATDVYGYYQFGRIIEHYRENPFDVPPAAFPDDPVMELTGEWAVKITPYGPVWMLAAAGASWLSGDSVQVGLVLLKGMGALFHLAAGGLIWLNLRRAPPAERAARTLLWAWNPALLLIFVVDGHNDVLMLVWLLLGAWLLQRGRHGWWGLVVMVLSPLTKLVGVLPIPFFYLALLRRQPNWRVRLALLAAGGGISLMVAWLAFLPFGSFLPLVRRLAEEASSGGAFSPAALLLLVCYALGLFPETGVITSLGAILLLGSIVWLLWQSWRGRTPLRTAAEVFGAYLLQALKFRIWYPSWLFPWLLLDLSGGRGRLTAGWLFLLNAQLSVVIYGHLWRLLLGPGFLSSHLIGVPFVFLLPLLGAYLALKSPQEFSDGGTIVDRNPGR